MKQTKEQQESAKLYLQNIKGNTVYALINSVSRSGMSRRIEFYSVKNGEIVRIGYYIARVLDMPYNVDKGGIRADDCGMDMAYSILSDLNYKMASLEGQYEILKAKGERIYDNYFFDASYRSL